MRGAVLLFVLLSLLSVAQAIECVYQGGNNLTETSAWSPSIPSVNDTATFKNVNGTVILSEQDLTVANLNLINSTVYLVEGSDFEITGNVTVDEQSVLVVSSQSALSSDRLINHGKMAISNGTIQGRVIGHYGPLFRIAHESKVSVDRIVVQPSGSLYFTGRQQPAVINDSSILTTRVMLYANIICLGEIYVEHYGEYPGPFDVISDKQHNITMYENSIWNTYGSIQMPDFDFIAYKMQIVIKAFSDDYTFSSINIVDSKLVRSQAFLPDTTFNLIGTGPSFISNLAFDDNAQPSIITSNHVLNMADFNRVFRSLHCSTNCTLNIVSNTAGFNTVFIKDSTISGSGMLQATLTATGTTKLIGTPQFYFSKDGSSESTIDRLYIDASAKVYLGSNTVTVNKITGTGIIASGRMFYNAAQGSTETLDLSAVTMEALQLNFLTQIVFSTNKQVQIGTFYATLDDVTLYNKYNNTNILSAPNGNIRVNGTVLSGTGAACFTPVVLNNGKTFQINLPLPIANVPVTLTDAGMLGDKHYVTVQVASLPSCFKLKSWVVKQPNGDEASFTPTSLKNNIELENVGGCLVVNVTARATVVLSGTETILKNTAAAVTLTTSPSDITSFVPSFDKLTATHNKEKFTISWPKSLIEDSVACDAEPAQISLANKFYDASKGSAMISVPKCKQIDLQPALVYTVQNKKYFSETEGRVISWNNPPTPSSKPTIRGQKPNSIYDSYLVELTFPGDATCDCLQTPVISVNDGTNDYFTDADYSGRYTKKIYELPANLTFTYRTKCGSQQEFSVEKTVSVYLHQSATTTTTTSSTTSLTSSMNAPTDSSTAGAVTLSVLLLVATVAMLLF